MATTYGPWRTDSAPIVGALLVTATTDVHPEACWGWISYSTGGYATPIPERFRQAWALDGELVTGAYQRNYFGNPGGTAQYGVTWLTVLIPASIPDTTRGSTPPSDVYDDPTVTGIEWAPSTPYSGLQGTLLFTPSNNFLTDKLAAGFPATLKLEANVGSRYEPAPETQSVINARPSVISVTASGQAFAIDDIAAGDSFAVTMVDPWTASGDYAPFDTIGDSVDYSTTVRVNAVYRPAFRLVHITPDVASVDVLMQGPALTRTEEGASALATMAAPTVEQLTVTTDFEEGVLGEIVGYRSGPFDLTDGNQLYRNRQGRYVEGKDSAIGLGSHIPFGGGASWDRFGIYGPTSVGGWEVPTNDATSTVDFTFHLIPDPGDSRLIDASTILEIQYHSADMSDQQDASIGIMFGYIAPGVPQEIRFYVEGYGDGLEYFEVHTNNTRPDEWYVAKHTVLGSEATFTVTDSTGDTVLTHTRTLPDGWVQNLWLEGYASTLWDTLLAPTQWLEVSIDNLDVAWSPTTVTTSIDVLMQGASLALDPDTVTARGVPTLLASSDGEIALTGTVTVDDTSVYPWWGNPHDAVVVGGPEGIWSDGSDATYAEVSTAGANGQPTGAGSTGGYNGAWVEMSDLAPEIPADARVESLTFRVRARHVAGQESPYNQGIYVQLYNATDFNVVAMAGGGNYEESDPPSANYPASWKFPDDHSWATQEYTVQAYNIAGATEGGWEAQGWDSQAEMDAWVDGRKKKLADTLRAGPVQVVVRGGAPPGDLPGFDAQDTQYDVAEVSLSYVLSSASDEIDLLMQSASLTRSTS
jgi:hypothetical protein